MSITYFLMDAEGEIAAIFTLTHKAVEIGNADISSTMRRKLSRYAQLDGNTNSYTSIKSLDKGFNFFRISNLYIGQYTGCSHSIASSSTKHLFSCSYFYLSKDFNLEDIRKIREYNSLRHIQMTHEYTHRNSCLIP